MTDLLEPNEYDGEDLCICCGSGMQSGRRYKICVDEGISHEESCERYAYDHGNLCARCDDERQTTG